MKIEFQAEFSLTSQNKKDQTGAIDYLVEKSNSSGNFSTLNQVKALGARLMLLTEARILGDLKEYARTGTRKKRGGLLYGCKSKKFDSFFERQYNTYFSLLGIDSSLANLVSFPQGTWGICIPFILRKPYLSKDDTDYYIIDNPIKKDWVFKLPYIAPSQWKGALRSTMLHEIVENLHTHKNKGAFIKERLQLYRIFGNEKEDTANFLNQTYAKIMMPVEPSDDDQDALQEWQDEFQNRVSQIETLFDKLLHEKGYRSNGIEGFRGRLHFYPTYFQKMNLEIINPHERDTGGGKDPIQIESVPPKTPGVFSLLYIPLDRIGQGIEETKTQVMADLELVVKGVKAMFTQYGFGAKTSSGFGVAQDQLGETGELFINIQSLRSEELLQEPIQFCTFEKMVENTKKAIKDHQLQEGKSG